MRSVLQFFFNLEQSVCLPTNYWGLAITFLKRGSESISNVEKFLLQQSVNRHYGPVYS